MKSINQSLLEIFKYFYLHYPDLHYISTPFWPYYNRKKYNSQIRNAEVNRDLIDDFDLSLLNAAEKILKNGEIGSSDWEWQDIEKYKNNTRLAYNKYAKEYSNDSEHQNYLDDLLLDFGNNIKSPNLVFDIGCGSGHDMVKLNRFDNEIIGVDLSFPMVSQARRKSKCFTLNMDLLNLGFASKCASGIWCAATLLHIERNTLQSVLDDFFRILLPKGIMFISVKQGKGMKLVYRKKTKELPRLFTFFSREELEKAVINVGFEKFDISRYLTYRENIGWDVWLNLLAQKRE